MQSPAERLASLPKAERDALIAGFKPEQIEELLYDWAGFNARPEQIEPPGDWDVWAIIAGRGFGKTRSGAEWVRTQVKNGSRRIALVAETQKDLEDVMVNGESGIMSVFPPAERPKVTYKPIRMVFPNGAVALGYNGTEPGQLRGPQFDAAWVDELAKFRYGRETWDMLQFALRLGDKPRVLVTTTPLPTDIIKDIVGGKEGKVHVTRGSTYDNASNLAAPFLQKIRDRYENTRLGRQELHAEILGDLPGALWTQASLDAYRITAAPEMKRIVIAIDPAISNTETSDEHGIIVAGLDQGNRGIILEDASMSGSPNEWARRAISLYREWDADAIVIEINQGGDMVAHTLRTVDPNVKIREVRASRGKHIRAEPASAFYEQGKVVHLGRLIELEAQMVQMTNAGYQGSGSPDRVDALVWAITDLFPHMTKKITPPPFIPQPAASLGAGRRL
jgi:phage terminase large subunit-like protein